MRTDHHLTVATHYLFFGGLFPAVRSLAFPCDPGGHVDMDEMSERARDNYLFARTVVGCDYDVPVVVAGPTDAERLRGRQGSDLATDFSMHACS